jgi:hypothetical protein
MSGTQANGIARVYDSLSGRNRIINGDMRVNQYASSVAVGSGNAYGGADRFYATILSAAGAFTQSATTITFNNVTRPALAQTVTTAVSSFTAGQAWSGIRQAIEGVNCYDLVGQPITISFIFNTNLTGTYCVSLEDNNGTHSYVTTFTATANTPAYYSFALPANNNLTIPNNTTQGLYCIIGGITGTTYQTSTLNSWVTGNFQSTGAATLWSATNGNFIAVTELQLEHGSIATPFEKEPYGVTLQKCQRYYETLPNGSWGSYGLTGNVIPFPVRFSVLKRVAPTMTGAFGTTNCSASIATSAVDVFYINATVTATGAYLFSNNGATTASAEY